MKNFSLLSTNLVTAVKVPSIFNLTTDIIRYNCNFDFYYNKTDVTPTVLDGGDEIILANWPNDNILYIKLTMTFQSRFQVIPMFW